MSRKIVSQTADTTTEYPSLNLPMAIYLEEDSIINGVELIAGSRDPRYPADKDLEKIELITLDGRIYHSVHENYTADMLKPTETNDYVIEKKLDGNFTYTVLNHNTGINNKFKKDPSIISLLGLPKFDAEKHTTDLFIQQTIDSANYDRNVEYEKEKEAKLSEDAAREDKPSQAEIEALAFSLASISSGTLTVETAVINNN
jgi:hypothetical protein